MNDFIIPERHACKTESELEAAAVMALFSFKPTKEQDKAKPEIRPMRFESAVVQQEDVIIEPDRLSQIQCELDQLYFERADLIQSIAAMQSLSNDLPLWFECGKTPKAPRGQPGFLEASEYWQSMRQEIEKILHEQPYVDMEISKVSTQGKIAQVQHIKGCALAKKCAGGFSYRLHTKDGQKAYHLGSIVPHTCLQDEKRCKNE